MIKRTRISGANISKQKNYIALDTETTGLSPEKDRMIEIGLLEIKNDQVVNSFCTMINPGIPVSASASAVNGITDADLANAPSYAEVAPAVAEQVLGKVIVAHNANFDVKFICAMLDEAGYDGEIRYVDTMSYSRKCVPDLPDHKLQTVAKHFSVDTGNAHRAVDDAMTCHEIFQHCKQLPQPKAETRSHTNGTPQATAAVDPNGKCKSAPFLSAF